MKLFNNLFPVIGLVILTGCATVNSPEGGPKDTTAPVLVSSNPKDQQLNVKTNLITLEFDEEVQQNNLKKELLITPNLENTYKVRSNKNQLILEFQKAFQDSTTYILNFRKGIQDITEKNVAQDLKLAFSTGSFIDSSRVKGTVVNLLTAEPLKEAIVAMYPADDTLSIRKNKPYYQTETNGTGEFTFTNIREGAYRIYALQDQNNNALYDNENERIAYLQSPIKVTPEEQQVELRAVKIDTKAPILLKRDRFADRFSGAYNEGVVTVDIKKEGSPKDTLSYKLGTDGRRIELFKTQNFSGGKVIITAVDSSRNIASDTIQIEFTTRYQQNINGAQIKVVNNNRDNYTYKPGQELTIELQAPFRITGTTPVSIITDSVSSIPLNYPTDIKLDRTATELTFTVPKLRTRVDPYSITLDSTQIIPVEGPRFSLPELQFQITEEGGTGSVTGKLITKYKSYTIQLINSNNKVVDEVHNSIRYNFKNNQPGEYRIRVMIDENNNGRWDGPDPTFERNPERVYFHPEKINIRANWVLEDVNIEIKE